MRPNKGACGMLIVSLARRGCQVVASDSTAPEIAELYENAENVAKAGLEMSPGYQRGARSTRTQSSAAP